MKFNELDTPSLLIDREILIKNIEKMQNYADRNSVTLRPHTKTHKMPYIAKLTEEKGAKGIAVAKIGEAEVMAENGLKDIFIANQIIGDIKFRRIAELAKKINISFGVDNSVQVNVAEKIFAEENVVVPVLIEIEVGENRSGIIEEEDYFKLLDSIKGAPHLVFKGIFSHDGNSYSAKDLDELRDIAEGAQKRTIHFAKLAEQYGMPCEVVSYGATPTFMNEVEILDGITELRPGTYVFMDASQGAAVGTLEYCAATVLASVISKPTEERVILDVGAKGLTAQERKMGICATPGKGTLYDYPETHIFNTYDEHAIIYDKGFHDIIVIGNKVRIIPVHICPVCNLYEVAYLISGDEVIKEIEIAGGRKLR